MINEMEWNTYEELQELIKNDENNKVVGSDALYNKIKDNLDYKLEYAEDRVKLLYDVMDMKLYVDCLSSKEHRDQQDKTKNTPRAEDAGYSMHLDKLGDYIIFCAYDNIKDRELTEALKEELKEIKKLKNKDIREKRRYTNRDKQRNRLSLLSNSRPTRAKVRIHNLEGFTKDSEGEFSELELHSDGYDEVVYSFRDKGLTDGKFENSVDYWIHYGRHNKMDGSVESIFNVDRTIPYWQNSYDIVNQMSESLELTKSLEFKKVYDEKEKKTLQRTKRELAEDYNLSVSLLRNPIRLSSSIPTTTVDYMLEFEREIDYTSKPVIKELFYSYAELKEKYGKKLDSLIWDMLIDFEEAIENIALNKTQKIVIEHILSTSSWSYNDIIDEIEKNTFKRISKQSVNHHIEGYVNKIVAYFTYKNGDIQK